MRTETCDFWISSLLSSPDGMWLLLFGTLLDKLGTGIVNRAEAESRHATSNRWDLWFILFREWTCKSSDKRNDNNLHHYGVPYPLSIVFTHLITITLITITIEFGRRVLHFLLLLGSSREKWECILNLATEVVMIVISFVENPLSNFMWLLYSIIVLLWMAHFIGTLYWRANIGFLANLPPV